MAVVSHQTTNRQGFGKCLDNITVTGTCIRMEHAFACELRMRNGKSEPRCFAELQLAKTVT